MGCGRIRKAIGRGYTPLIDTELATLKFAMIALEEGESLTFETGDREYGCLLVSGECQVWTGSGLNAVLGPRMDPWKEKAWAALATRDEKVTFKAHCKTLISVGSTPAEKKMASMVITPDMVEESSRGTGNWQRNVRFVIWTDNSRGNCIIVGETVTPAGNWSTMPPHRHQYYIPGEEVPYEEVYYFRFSKPQGFGLIWQFDDKGNMDQAFSLKNGDAVFMDKGYHPVACGPGASLYQVTMMAGPYRMSKSRVHDDYKFILGSK